MRRTVSGPYDLILLLFHSFGFFSDDENAELLRAWCSELAPSGHLIIDLWNRERILERFAPRSVRRVSAELAVEEERTWDPASERLQVRYTYDRAGQKRRYDTSFRLYSREQLEDLLQGCGCRVAGTFGSLEGAPCAPDAPRLVVWARNARSTHRAP